MNLEEVGAKLKKIRQEKGLSLEDVQKKTKIHINILKAIEGEGLTNLNPIYLKGFLKIYCNFLGLEPKDYIPDYKESQPPKNTEAKKEEPLKLEKSPSLPKIDAVRLTSLISLPKRFKKVLISAVIVVIALLFLFYLSSFIASKYKEVTSRKEPVSLEPAKKESRKEVKPPKTKNTTALSMQPTLKKDTISGVRLVVRAHDNCWLFLKSDGRTVFKRVLEKGRSESWQAKDKMELSVGNAGAIELEVNGQIFSSLGKKNQKLNNIVITKDGLSIPR